jgi:hypothetical protein
MSSILQNIPGGKLGLAAAGLLGAAFLDAKLYISRDIKKVLAGVGMQKEMAAWDVAGTQCVVERFIASVGKFPGNKAIVAQEDGKWVSWTFAEVDTSE